MLEVTNASVPQASRSSGHSFFIREKAKGIRRALPATEEGVTGRRERMALAESDCCKRQAGTWKIISACFTDLPRAGLGAFISTTQDDICGEMS